MENKDKNPAVVAIVSIHTPGTQITPEKNEVAAYYFDDTREELVEEVKANIKSLKEKHIGTSAFGPGAKKLFWCIYVPEK
jgi:hypothetical protein